MAEHSTIEWTDATWNPITGCTMVSAGCTNCYAMGLAATRLRNHPSREGLTRNSGGRAVWRGEVRLNEQWIDQPLRWRRPRRIFVCAHGDLFHEAVPDEWIDRVFGVMALAPHHTFQVLTKRPERARDYLSRLCLRQLVQCPEGKRFLRGRETDVLFWKLPLPNVWLGTSIEDQAMADARIPHLLATPAAVRFLSAEPLLGPVNLESPDIDAVSGWRGVDPRFTDADTRIDWVIVGGESGPGARPMHPDWARSLRDQCEAAGVAFFFKQWGEWATVYDREHVDPDWRRCGDMTREYPKGRWLNLDGGHGFHGARVCYVAPLGKKAAGRLLDGRTWDEVPSHD